MDEVCERWFLVWQDSPLSAWSSQKARVYERLFKNLTIKPQFRCFLYLFPSHVTWFLLATLLLFTYANAFFTSVSIQAEFFCSAIEWSSFIVLDIGLEVTQSLPPGTRAVAGLFQSFAVRASGFSIVNLSDIAPSFQYVFLCNAMLSRGPESYV